MVVTDGDTVILLPVPITVLPQEPANHSAVAPAPIDPPSTVNVVLLPLQIVVLPVMPVGATDGVFTVTVTDAQAVAPQVPE